MIATDRPAENLRKVFAAYSASDETHVEPVLRQFVREFLPGIAFVCSDDFGVPQGDFEKLKAATEPYDTILVAVGDRWAQDRQGELLKPSKGQRSRRRVIYVKLVAAVPPDFAQTTFAADFSSASSDQSLRSLRSLAEVFGGDVPDEERAEQQVVQTVETLKNLRDDAGARPELWDAVNKNRSTLQPLDQAIEKLRGWKSLHDALDDLQLDTVDTLTQCVPQETDRVRWDLERRRAELFGPLDRIEAAANPAVDGELLREIAAARVQLDGFMRRLPDCSLEDGIGLVECLAERSDVDPKFGAAFPELKTKTLAHLRAAAEDRGYTRRQIAKCRRRFLAPFAAIEQCFDELVAGKFLPSPPDWTRELREIGVKMVRIADGAPMDELEELKSGLLDILDREPGIANTRIVAAADDLRFDPLVAAMESLRPVADGLGTEEASRSLIGLEEHLRDLVRRHDAWQRLHQKLLNMQSALRNPTQARRHWKKEIEPDTRKLLLSPGEPWLMSLREASDKIDTALEGFDPKKYDPTQLEEGFEEFLAAARNRFKVLDDALLAHCGRLCRLGVGLKSLLEVKRPGQSLLGYQPLHITVRADGIKTRIIARGYNGETAEQTIVRPVLCDADADRRAITRNLRPSGAVPDNRLTAAEVVERMSDFLFPKSILSVFASCYRHASDAEHGLRIQIDADAEHAHFPWEAVSMAGASLADKIRTPIVRVPVSDRPMKAIAVSSPLRILGVVSQPTGLAALDFAAERQQMDKAFAAASANGRVALDWLDRGQGRQFDALRDRLSKGDYHILHFIGHGEYDPTKEVGSLCLEGADGSLDLVPTQSLVNLLVNTSLSFVFLNACETAKGGVLGTRGGMPGESMASLLVRAGIPAALGFRLRVADIVAVKTATLIYNGLAENRSVEMATAEARTAVRDLLKDDPDRMDWADAILYCRFTDGRLFRVD